MDSFIERAKEIRILRQHLEEAKEIQKRMEMFDSVRKKNIIFHITKMNNLQIVAEYPDWSRSKWGTKWKESNEVSTDEKINSAIKNRQIITFSYTDNWNNNSQRIFSPEKILRKGHTLCVTGYDHVKKANRVFAIRKMKDIKFKISEDIYDNKHV